MYSSILGNRTSINVSLARIVAGSPSTLPILSAFCLSMSICLSRCWYAPRNSANFFLLSSSSLSIARRYLIEWITEYYTIYTLRVAYYAEIPYKPVFCSTNPIRELANLSLHLRHLHADLAFLLTSQAWLIAEIFSVRKSWYGHLVRLHLLL